MSRVNKFISLAASALVLASCGPKEVADKANISGVVAPSSQVVIGMLDMNQLQILDTASRYVKPGGRLVYSTCALNPKENENVCKDFLLSHTDFKSVIPTNLCDGTYIKDCFVTLMPHINGTDGFFIAVFEKEV